MKATLYFPQANWNQDVEGIVMNKLRYTKIDLPIIPQKGMWVILDEFINDYSFTINEKIIYFNCTRNEKIVDEEDFKKYEKDSRDLTWQQFEIVDVFIHKEHLELWLEYN